MKHLITQPHIIFSVENSPYPDKVQAPISHEDAVNFLKMQGLNHSNNVFSIDGHYGSPEKSIFISNPTDEQKDYARLLSHMTGQESHIESDGKNHALHYGHGPEAGKILRGQGTDFYDSQPNDMYSVLPDGTYFSHNFNNDIKKAKEEAGMSPANKKTFRQERKKFSGDPLQHEMTSTPGVSDIGIEVRRADKKQPGVVSHGYGRVGDADFHKERAKKYLQQRYQGIKNAPTPKLTKGAHGDWKKEGYRIEHTPINSRSLENPTTEGFQIDAFDKEGNWAGGAKFKHHNNGKSIYPHMTTVSPLHRRVGLATAIYRTAEKLSGKKLIPDDWQTPDAKALWAQPKRPFGKSLQKNKEDKGLHYQQRFSSHQFKTPQEAEARLRGDVEHYNKQFANVFGHTDYESDVAPHVHFPKYRGHYVIASKQSKVRNPRKPVEYNTSEELRDKQSQIHFDLYPEHGVGYSKIQNEHIDNLMPLESVDENKVYNMMAHIKQGRELPPILVEKDGGIIDGHHRYEAAKRLKIKNVPVIKIHRPGYEDFDKSLQKATPLEDLKSQGYKFRIFNPTKNREAFAVATYHKGKRVGHVLYDTRSQIGSKEPHKQGFHQVYRGHVEEPHRGKGLYQHMLNIAADHVKTIGGKGLMSEGFQRSPDATRVWDKVASFANAPNESTSIKPLPYGADYFLQKSKKYYHITDNPNFKPDPNYAPEDNSISIHDRSGRKGLYVTDNPEKWVNQHGYLRPFIAEVDIDESISNQKDSTGRWSGERFIPSTSYDKVKVNRVIPIDAYAREEFGGHGWVEERAGEEFDTGKQIKGFSGYPYRGYRYANDTRKMPSVEVQKLQQHFNKIKKNDLQKASLPSAPKVNINPEHGRKIADAYHNMKHDPNHPEVKAAYGALIDETKKQFKDMLDRGLKISKVTDPKHNPYPTSKHLHADVDKGHMWLFPTDLGFGSEDDIPKDHPMLQPTEFMHEGKPLLANDVFRLVHDKIHHKLRNGFGPKGEHESFLEHKKMYSPLAQKALATETMGQNSFVNFSSQIGHLNQAKPGSAYAPQKAGLLSDDIVHGRWHE